MPPTHNVTCPQDQLSWFEIHFQSKELEVGAVNKIAEAWIGKKDRWLPHTEQYWDPKPKELVCEEPCRRRQRAPAATTNVWRQGAAIGKKPRVAGFSSVLRPEGSGLGRARGGTDGLDGELLLLAAWNPTNTSIPLYPPLQPEMLYRARIEGGGEGCAYLCANITKYSLPLCKYPRRFFECHHFISETGTIPTPSKKQ